MINVEEEFHPSVSAPVTLFGSIERNWGFALMIPGAAWMFFGMFSLRLGHMAGGLTLMTVMLTPGIILCRSNNNPHFLSDLCLSAADWFLDNMRLLVPEPGLRGKDGL